ncbi:hypothetical protein A0H81_12477 [Grifola frondosa]|uniref:Uncharacterized protein n=1 Tax=Grifola frondosa TaxID=5627 RepID=A0A1C7LSG1_GRIFR|nr:hypothetical protein A0H81_12477 [Grifola frondosa]
MSPSSSPSPSLYAPSKSQGHSQKRAIAEVISETFPPFNHRTVVVEPFDNEAKRDADFTEKLNVMLLELLLDFHAWSTSRPTHESDQTADTLEKDIKAVIEMEKEQGMFSPPTSVPTSLVGTRIFLAFSLLASLDLCLEDADYFLKRKNRQRLNDFVTRIKLALAALTGLTA